MERRIKKYGYILLSIELIVIAIVSFLYFSGNSMMVGLSSESLSSFCFVCLSVFLVTLVSIILSLILFKKYGLLGSKRNNGASYTQLSKAYEEKTQRRDKSKKEAIEELEEEGYTKKEINFFLKKRMRKGKKD